MTFIDGCTKGAPYADIFVQVDLHQMPFAAASFDGCRAELLLLHSAQLRQVVEKMWQVVHPVAALSSPNPISRWSVDHGALMPSSTMTSPGMP